MHRQLGLSLTELMIAITLGAFVALAGSTFYVTTVSTGKTIFNKTRATEQARAVIDTIAHDFRRVGYRGDSAVISDLSATLSAFLFPSQDFMLGEASGEAANSCITYSYEAVNDATGLPETLHYGFKLVGGTVQATNNGAATCDAATHWEAATDANSVWIDKLAFSANYRCYDAEDGSLADASDSELSCGAISACGDSISCFERRQLSIALCAYPLDSGSAGDCQENNNDSSPEGQLYAVLSSTSRNDLLFFSNDRDTLATMTTDDDDDDS
jgi:type II secretory pathway component PulJ